MSPLLRHFVHRFARDQRGLAATEFALIAPLMFVLYFGLAEFCQAYMANRRANHTASMVADLVAQGDQTSVRDLGRALDIGGLIIKPFDPESLSIRISSVTLNARGQPVVDWSRSRGRELAPLDKNATLTSLPSGLAIVGESLIIGETHYSYASSATRVIQRPLNFSRSYYLRPRVSDKVICRDC